ncbi:MAG: transporter binding protein [Candidatus Brocadiaceae bacterium]|nr:transporter binding protein [Candidatus Brocadiaceae bacterium]
MNTVIKVENLGKKYFLRHQKEERYSALRDVITNKLKSLGKRVFNHESHEPTIGNASVEEFWALKDVSFEIKQGDRVGIIGRNGAGKSTLLKILSRITEPTTGRVAIKGRVASLLEVGTGFHPELTGRENIFLNGAILGMRRAEIIRKFDEMVAFAEVEKFLDTPVKRYSSGMYVRLAFAVAAHLEPEILIIDEVLAVGDAQFQKKCLGKMEDVARGGRTVLFVSHNMNAIEQLCTSALLLERGVVKKYDADVCSVIKEYLFGSDGETKNEWVNPGKILENPWFKPLKLYLTNEHGGKHDGVFKNDTEIWLQVEGEIKQTEPSLQIGYAIYSEEGNLLYWSCHTDVIEEEWPKLNNGYYVFRSQIPKRWLNEGMYRIELIVALYFKQWLSEPGKNAPSVYLTIQGGLSDSSYWMIRRPGLLAPVLRWDTKNKTT